jgi:hypothetical protein
MAFGDHILNSYVQVWQAAKKDSACLSKFIWTMDIATFHVTDGVVRHKLIDDIIGTGVPHLFKPTACQIRHVTVHERDPPCGILMFWQAPAGRNRTMRIIAFRALAIPLLLAPRLCATRAIGLTRSL